MLSRILNWFGQDGLAHILVSLVICCVLGAFLPTWAAVLITAFVGAAKEVVWDLWLKKGSASWHDIICDGIGILLGAAMTIMFNF